MFDLASAPFLNSLPLGLGFRMIFFVPFLILYGMTWPYFHSVLSYHQVLWSLLDSDWQHSRNQTVGLICLSSSYAKEKLKYYYITSSNLPEFIVRGGALGSLLGASYQYNLLTVDLLPLLNSCINSSNDTGHRFCTCADAFALVAGIMTSFL